LVHRTITTTVTFDECIVTNYPMYHQRVRKAVDEINTEFTQEELRNRTNGPRTIVDDIIDEMH
jgi:hypothetical protein